MHMIVGLGNPGPRYANNRHNIGFQVVERLAARHGIALNRSQFRARLGDGLIARRPLPGTLAPGVDSGTPGRKVLLVQPQTYMNASGEAVGQLARYYQIRPEGILIVHDHMDLERGRLRLRAQGGAGGNNGVKSIIQHLGSDAFPRIRVGVGRPPGRMDPAAYVLQDFGSQEEKEIFGVLRETICDAVECWLLDGLETAMNRYNG